MHVKINDKKIVLNNSRDFTGLVVEQLNCIGSNGESCGGIQRLPGILRKPLVNLSD